MRKLLAIYIGLGFVAACGGPEVVQETKAALTPASYNIGNGTALVYSAPWPIDYEQQYVGPLPPPAINPSSASAFDVWTQMDNGENGTGAYNALIFEVTMVNDPRGLAFSYYVGKLNVWFSDTYGLNTTYYGDILSATATGNGGGTGQTIQFYWQNPRVDIVVVDWHGNIVKHVWTNVNFNTTPGYPDRIYSPDVTFTMDTSGSYGGCMHDVPNYDQSGVDLGDLAVKTLYGRTSASTPAYFSSPTSNSHCSMNVVHDTTHQTDTVQWHVDGF